MNDRNYAMLKIYLFCLFLLSKELLASYSQIRSQKGIEVPLVQRTRDGPRTSVLNLEKLYPQSADIPLIDINSLDWGRFDEVLDTERRKLLQTGKATANRKLAINNGDYIRQTMHSPTDSNIFETIFNRRREDRRRRLLVLSTRRSESNDVIETNQRFLASNTPFANSTRLSSAIVDLKDIYNQEYIGLLSVGTPSQYIPVVFDSGSSDFWTPTTACTNCENDVLYNVKLSTTYKPIYSPDPHPANSLEAGQKQINVTLLYGSGGVKGYLASETLGVGTFKVPEYKIVLVTHEDSTIVNFDMTGLLGLAYPTLSALPHAYKNPKPFCTVLAESNPQLMNGFSVYMTRNEKAAVSSKIIFGGYDLDYVGPNALFYYVPLIPARAFYQVEFKGLEVGTSAVFRSVKDFYSPTSFALSGKGGVQYSACTDLNASCVAIVDTGTTGLGIPSKMFKEVFAVITRGKVCDFNLILCLRSSVDEFPVIMLTFYPDLKLPLLPTDYVMCDDDDTCYFRLQPSNSAHFVLGDSFNGAYYTYFDLENNRIGFACPAPNSCRGGDWNGAGGILYPSSLSLWKRLLFASMLLLCFISSGYVLVTVIYNSAIDKLEEHIGWGSALRPSSGKLRTDDDDESYDEEQFDLPPEKRSLLRSPPLDQAVRSRQNPNARVYGGSAV